MNDFYDKDGLLAGLLRREGGGGGGAFLLVVLRLLWEETGEGAKSAIVRCISVVDAGAEMGDCMSTLLKDCLRTSRSLDIVGRFVVLVFGDQVRSKSDADCVARR